MKKRLYDSKVYLVGAGPGDAGLLTVKGRELLKEADTVIYDALAGDGILGWIPEEAEQIYVGKRSGCHSSTQEEINKILVEEGKKGRLVVRLKGGDPFVFGRGGEEVKALLENHIPFEVVPGITSAVAVPAYCGIPVTHRGKASSFHVITGHSEAGKEGSVDYEALVKTGGTLIFLMGVGAAEEICGGLIRAGISEETPAAFLQEGTTAGQRKVISTVSRLAEDGRAAGIKPPAIMVIGEVCSLGGTCSWAENRALSGRKILVTRPERRASGMTGRLRAAGAEVVELPSVKTELPEDLSSIYRALDKIDKYGWLVFTSPSGVELFFEVMAGRKMDIRSLAGIKIAVIGRATGAVLEERGLYPAYMPKRYYAKELGEGLVTRAAGERILILRAEQGSPELTRPLREAGVSYDDTVLYRTVIPGENAQAKRVRQKLAVHDFDYVTFTSGSTVRGFMENLKPEHEWLSGFRAVCIGEETKKAAAACGMDCITAEIPTMDSMAERMEEDAGKSTGRS
ncbi:uroporphyrinogen-III C-methyltransferase [[Clostridium] symbiosum]|uniref:uroporphyrinogen-III C-methyltransferase n=1 Tax=Clostridium symbiosum TaxID=1512 RepID=UPI001D073D66|nr:uroporphyrinogen-III C-methyltransferase [[Clostridium] symbiosum]MCB6609664.1 uroporphyrinogen-III C-methyltransferase [[Clostridium] symbiosum]MCB6931930.1 uroporphyrinogen-III C-methyltransferase [[Clostridium] symbiosum]